MVQSVIASTIITITVIVATTVLAFDGAIPGEAATGILGAAIPTAALGAIRRPNE
jgi:hypothetical protein